MSKLVPMHGRDHRPGGADPIPGAALVWTALPLSNGWTAGGVTPAYAQDSFNIYHLRGVLLGGEPGLTAATLSTFEATQQQQILSGTNCPPAVLVVTGGALVIYVNRLSALGFSKWQQTDNGNTFNVGSGTNVLAGQAVAGTDGWANVAYGGNFNARLMVSSLGGVNVRRLIGLPADGWGINGNYGGSGAFAIQSIDGPYSDCMAELEIADAAGLANVAVSTMCRIPMIAASATVPQGIHFQITNLTTGAWKVMTNAIGDPGALATPHVVATGTASAISNGDLIRIVGHNGGQFSCWINTTLIYQGTQSHFFSGYPGFGLDSTGTFNTTLVTNFRYGYPDTTYWTPTALNYSLDGVTFQGL